MAPKTPLLVLLQFSSFATKISIYCTSNDKILSLNIQVVLTNSFGISITHTGKYSGQKHLFLPHPPNFETPISSLFFYFRKICSHHHRHHFHLRFCWVLGIGWGRRFFVKKFEKEELNIKELWCGMGRRVFEGKRTLASKILQLVNQHLMNLTMCYCNQLRLIDFLITFVF